MSEDLNKEIEKVLINLPEARHSYYQLKHFVIGKEVTNQARMWQCLRELQARKKTIDSAEMQIEELKDKIELIDIKRAKEELNIEEEKNEFKKVLIEKERIIFFRSLERQKNSLLITIKELEDTIKFSKQEALFFLKTFQSIEINEPLKDYDDLESQEEYWNEKIAQKIHLKLLMNQGIDTELAETALSLHENALIRQQMEKILNASVENNSSKVLEKEK